MTPETSSSVGPDRARPLAWALAILNVGAFVWLARLLPLAEPLERSWSWVPSMGVELAFRLDALSAGFALLITSIGALVLLYTQGYMAGSAGTGRLLSRLLFFEAAMLGLVLSDDLISLFVFWELTSVASFLLIGFHHTSEASRRAARRALVVTAGGGLALLVGLILVRAAATDLGLDPASAGRLSALSAVDLTAHPLAPWMLGLLLVGAFTKSAQMPFHLWLPGAMAAPTPVSAYLHSATMVKAGIYLLARVNPVFGDMAQWHWTLVPVGLVTMSMAAFMALRQNDLKRILAYSTVSVLGILVALLGLGTEAAVEAAVVFLVAHALYKASLFMIAGILDHQTGTRRADLLSGLRRAMPWTAGAGVLAALSKAGAPPMFGFVGKELLYKAKLDLDLFSELTILVAVVTNVALVASAMLVGVKPFFGAVATGLPHSPREAPLSMLAGPWALGLLGIGIGLVPAAFDEKLGGAMASVVLGTPVEMKLKLWHGLNPSALLVLGLSGLTLLVGIRLYLRLRRRRLGGSQARPTPPPSPLDRLFEAAMDGLPRGAGWLTARLHGGGLRRDVAVALGVVVALLAAVLARSTRIPTVDGDLRPLEAMAVILVLAGTVLALRRARWLTAVIGVGVTGLGVSLIFLLQGAPDLALTQLMVETLSVLLLVAVLLRLRQGRPGPMKGPRPSRVLLAGAMGLAVGATVWLASTVRMEEGIGEFFAAASVPEAKGRNVVNVILTDFRALDTLGEITVLALAGAGIAALLRARRARPSEGGRS